MTTNTSPRKTFSTRHKIDTIDDYLRDHGYTVTRDHYSKSDITLRKEMPDAWLFDRKFHSKADLVKFANSL